MILTIGQNIMQDKYVIVDFLGKGGFGEVYRARNNRLTGKEVAIKVIERGEGSTTSEFDDYQRRFEMEANIGAQISDENVIGVVDLDQEGDTWLLITEYASGGDLKARILKGGVSVEEARTIGAQICKGAAALHRSGYVHRDIKPSNILFDSQGRAKVADLGLVQTGESILRDLGMAGQQPGTPQYMSPEQETETGFLRPASDVFAIGCVLFELLTGKVYRNLQTGTSLSSLNPQVPPQLETVIAKALAVAVEERYPDADEMRKALDKVSLAAPGSKPVPEVQAADPRVLELRTGEKVRTLEEFVRAADANWIEAASLLGGGKLDAWLLALQQPELAARIQAVRQKQPDSSLALEDVLYEIQPDLPRPQLKLEPESIDFGRAAHGERRSLRLTLSNATRGQLVGKVEALAPWLRLARDSFRLRAGQTQTIDIGLDTLKMADGDFVLQPGLKIDSNGGQAELPVHAAITWDPSLAVNPTTLSFGEYLIRQNGQVRQVNLSVRNRGGGVLSGTLATPANWLAISPASFEIPSEQEAVIQVSADPAQLSQMGLYSAEITVTSSAGSQTIPARISAIVAGLESAVRWKNWGIYLALALAGLAGWAIPLAYAGAWLFGLIVENPDLWQIILLAGLPVGAWIAYAVILPKIVPTLNQAEDFYHGAALAREIPLRRPGGLQRLVFAGLLGGAAVGLSYLNPRIPTISFDHFNSVEAITTLLRSLPFTGFGLALTFLAGALLAALLLHPRPGGALDRRSAKAAAAPRALLLALLCIWLAYAINGLSTPWTALIWPAALGLLLGSERFASHPVRTQWLFAHFMPALPSAALLGLFYLWARRELLSPNTYAMWDTYNTLRVAYLGGDWWRSLVYVLVCVGLAGLGVWLGLEQRDEPLRPRLAAVAAGVALAGPAALLVYFVFGLLGRLMGAAWLNSSVLGWTNVLVSTAGAALVLWALSDRKRLLKRSTDWISARLGALFSRLPGLARRLTENVKEASLRAGIDQGDLGQVDLSDAADRARQVFGRARLDTGLGDFLSGDSLVPLSAAWTALLFIFFALPPTYSLLAGLLRVLLGIGQAVLIIVLCLGVPALLLFAGYRLVKRSQINIRK